MEPKLLEYEKIHVNYIVKGFANKHAKLLNQDKLIYQAVFSARFDEQHEDDQVFDEIELYIN